MRSPPERAASVRGHEKRREFVAALHGLRGLAVLYVVFSHIGNNGARLFPVPHNGIGKVGVWIFFGLSAFLLTTGLRAELSRLPRSTAIARYAVHRVFRIYPLYLVILAIHWVIGDMDGAALLRHVALVEGDRELWAIPVEFQYYLVVPLIAVLSGRMAIAVLSAGLVASAVYAGIRPDAVFSNGLLILPKAAPFLTASLLLFVRPPSAWAAPIGWGALLSLLACTVAFRHLSIIRSLSPAAPWLSIAISIAVAGLIHGLRQPGRLATVFSAAPLVWIGEISFSLYLLHLFVIRAVFRWGLDPTLAGWIALALSVALAACTYRLIERPGIEAGRWLGRRWQPALAP